MSNLPEKPNGRPPGSINKRTQAAIDILAKQEFCPITALIEVHREAVKNYAYFRGKESIGQISPMEDQSHKYLKIAMDSAGDLASYAFSKLKTVEHKAESPIDNLTSEEKLMHLKSMVLELEKQGIKEADEPTV